MKILIIVPAYNEAANIIDVKGSFYVDASASRRGVFNKGIKIYILYAESASLYFYERN